MKISTFYTFKKEYMVFENDGNQVDENATDSVLKLNLVESNIFEIISEYLNILNFNVLTLKNKEEKQSREKIVKVGYYFRKYGLSIQLPPALFSSIYLGHTNFQVQGTWKINDGLWKPFKN